MNVVSSQSWEQAGGTSWRKISVALGHYDLDRLVAEDRVEGYWLDLESDEVRIVDSKGADMPTQLRFLVMQAQADLLLIGQMYSEGAFGEPGFDDAVKLAKAQVAEVRARVPILK